MKIFNAPQIKQWDAFTIQEGISSLDLMDKAANACAQVIQNNFSPDYHFTILCGCGNNGGDGLAIARLLHQNGYQVQVYIFKHQHTLSDDTEAQLRRLQSQTQVHIEWIQQGDRVPDIPKHHIIIDALLGSGTNRVLTGWLAQCITELSYNKHFTIAIDIPSGLIPDQAPNPSDAILKANLTLTFERFKLAMLLEESLAYCGHIECLPIGLSSQFEKAEPSKNYLLTKDMAQSLVKRRPYTAHKNAIGSVDIVAGSIHTFGAMALSATAAMRAGIGKLYVHTPLVLLQSINNYLPEAMVVPNGQHFLQDNIALQSTKKIALIGPGIGLIKAHETWLAHCLQSAESVVLDADALNIIAQNHDLFKHIPEGSILTPHIGEFDRLIGNKTSNSSKRIALAKQIAQSQRLYVVLKSARTCIITPEGYCYYNVLGNPGMATAGSGDVLAGIIAGLLAQHYKPKDACLLGVYLHSKAGDLAAQQLGEAYMLARDIISNLSPAWLSLN